ncbi:MAG: hypothetical protein H7320_10275 [Ferruginibacter sp.]|nr:hypothetical protein [Ferruginibacter sp.]
MKKHYLLMLLLVQLTLTTKTMAQNIAINATGSLPDTSAMLDVSSSNKGFLVPRMTTILQNSIPLPANGLLIFNTTDNVFKVNTGTSASPVWTPLATGSGVAINSLNGLTGTTQTFATGTTGTDFGISSSGTVHTFNLPTASASNRGALLAADWSTFSNKQNALGFTPYNSTNPSGYISSSSIAGATDATITTPTNNQLLQYNSATGKWVNTTPGFLSSYTETDPIVRAINGIVKSNGTTISAAVAGTDYVIPSGSITGNAATVTTNANLTGPITSTGNATSVASQTGTGTTFVMSASPTLTGTPTLPSGTIATTQITGNNSTAIATTAFVTAAVSGGTTTNFTGSLAGEVTGTQSATVVGNAAVIGKVLTGYTSGAGTVTATDNILQAVQKINGNDVLKAPLASPTLTGIPLAPTAIAGTNTTQIASTAFVNTAISSGSAASFSGSLAGEVTGTQSATVVGNAAVIGKVLTGYTSGAGTVLITDNILQAIQKINGNDALKAPLASPTLTGVPAAPTAIAGTNTTQIATTAFVNSAISAGTSTSFSGSLAGDVTGTQSATVVGKINGTSLAGLSTGILKNTTTTGVPSIAVAADFPILNQNTTGTASNVTGIVAVANGGTGQSSSLNAGGVMYGSSATTMAVTAAGTGGQVLQSAGAAAPVWVNGGSMMLSGNSNNVAITTVNTSTSNYFPMTGTISSVSTIDVQGGTRTLMSRAGTIRNLYVLLDTKLLGNKNLTITVYKNGVIQTLAVSMNTPLSTSASDTIHSFTVAAGHEVGIVISSISTPANNVKVSWSADVNY